MIDNNKYDYKVNTEEWWRIEEIEKSTNKRRALIKCYKSDIDNGTVKISKVRKNWACGICKGLIVKNSEAYRIQLSERGNYNFAEYFHLDCCHIIIKD